MASLQGNLGDLLLRDKEIQEDYEPHKSSKIVKLRFTRKQYDAFRDACKIFEIVSSNERFPEFVKECLGADIRVPTIASQFVRPIVEAPMRIPIKMSKAPSSEQKKVTYFTSPIDVTENCRALYDNVEGTVELKQDINNGKTSLTDVRVMVGKYISNAGLKVDEGTVLDEFLCHIAPETVEHYRDQLMRVNDMYVIPKGDRKIMAGMVNEVAFGKF